MSLASYIYDQINVQPSFKMLSRSSSVYSSRRESGIDLKQALQELDKYYWKTHQEFLHNYNTRANDEDANAVSPLLDVPKPSERARGRSRRTSFRRAISAKGTTGSPITECPPVPNDVYPIFPSPLHRSSSRSTSPTPPVRSAAKSFRQPSPVPSFHGPSEYIYDSDVRAKLKAYLTPDKFQEALDYGFPSVMPTPEMKDSPTIPAPRPSTRGRNPGLDVQRFMRNEVISWMGSEDQQSAREILQPNQPESDSEREVESFARELAAQNAVPVPTNEDMYDDYYGHEFSISDYENAIDDSQDDRGTPSPVSPATPITPDNVHLPLTLNASTAPCRRQSGMTNVVPRGTTNPRCQSLEQFPQHIAAGPAIDGDVTRSLDMIRTAPPIPTCPPPQPPERRISHNASKSMSSADISCLPHDSACSSVKPARPHTSHHRPVSPLHEQKTTRRLTQSSSLGNNSCIDAVPHRHRASTTQLPSRPNVRESMTKPLPLRPYENTLPVSPAIEPHSPRFTPDSLMQHSRVAKNYSYDSPSAYVTPRTPPITPLDGGPRQMTLRMTLTRPELRAADEDIYGKAGHGSPVVLHHQARSTRSPMNRAVAVSRSGNARKSSSTNIQWKSGNGRRRAETHALRSNNTSVPEATLASIRRAATDEKTSGSNAEKREPSKLKKSRTEPILLDQPIPPPSHRKTTSMQPSQQTFPANVPLAQLGADGEWHLVSPSMAAAQQGHRWGTHVSRDAKDSGEKEKRKSLWKKMSRAGLRKPGPSIVLP